VPVSEDRIFEFDAGGREMAPIADAIAARQQALTEEWARQVRADPQLSTSDGLTHQQLVDHLPTLFRELLILLRGGEAKRVEGAAAQTAQQHGRLRWDHGYRIDELVQEMEILRALLVAELVKLTELRSDIAAQCQFVLGRFFRRVMTETVQEYVRQQQSVLSEYMTRLESGQEELARLNAKLEEAGEARLHLTRIVSHEMRNFLQCLAMALRVLEEDPADRRALALASTQVSDMGLLLNQLLDYSRLLDPKRSVALEYFEIQPLFDELIDSYRPLARGRGVAFQGDCSVAARHVIGDRLKVKQIAANLLSNAIRHATGGAVWLYMADHDDERWLLAVLDRSSAEETPPVPRLSKDFDPLPPQLQTRGTDIGLAISRELADVLGGGMYMRVTPEAGSTFLVLLPKNEP
jgi:signal transduction histidine kinase